MKTSIILTLPKVVMLETNVTIWTADETTISEIDEISQTTVALTKMEQKVFDYIKRGKTYKEISDEYKKMGVNSKMELVSGRYKTK